MEKLVAKARLLRESASSNRSKVDSLDPTKVYVWIHRSDERIAWFESLGYQICRDPKVRTQWKTEDGSHRRGDVVLMQIDKDLHEAFKIDSEARSVEALEGTREGFLAFATSRGIPARDNSREV